MALIVKRDMAGLAVEVRCEERGCDSVLGIRGDPGEAPNDVGIEVIDLADWLGWRLAGRTWCPDHVCDRPRRLTPVGDGYSWAHVLLEGSEPVKGSRRLA